jgi:NHL repeat
MTLTRQTQEPRAASKAARGPLRSLCSLAIAVASLLALAPGASAFKVVSEPGTGGGQTRQPTGLAVDFETGRLFVADSENNRIDVFDAAGNFEKAFGWGVLNGKSELQVCTTSCREGLSGSGAGQFKRPTEIAVDNSPVSSSRHDVYVVDSGNSRIERFGPDGAFKLSFGSPGEGEGQFSGQLLVGIGPGGTVYAVDSIPSGTEFEHRLQKFDPSGVAVAPQELLFKERFPAHAFAVDSSGDFYVSPGDSIRKYNGDGDFITEIQESFEEPKQIVVSRLAIGAEDNLFALSTRAGIGKGVSVMEFDPAGNRLRRFGYGSLLAYGEGIAPYHSASGDVYVSEAALDLTGAGYRVLHLDFPGPGPLVFPEPCQADPLGNTKATLNAKVNPEGKATTFHFEYVDQKSFEEEGGFSSPDTASTTEQPLPRETKKEKEKREKENKEKEEKGEEIKVLGEEEGLFRLQEASAQATGLTPETNYRCRVIATNADAPAGNEGEEGTFLTKEPFEILETAVSAVGTDMATLNAVVNPLGIPTNGYFEYVSDADYQADVAGLGPGHGFDHAIRVPEAPDELDFGAGEEPSSVSAQITALDPATLYHLRVRVDDHLPSVPPRNGPQRTFRTFAPTGALPDHRAWEMVSPAQKNNAEVAVPNARGGLFTEGRSVRVQAAAPSGEALTYTSWTSFANPQSAPSSSQYLSSRTPGGWATENISPFGFLNHPLEVPYRGFTPDLRFGAVISDEPQLTPEAQVGSENLYLRDNATGALQALTIEAPQLAGTQGFCSGYAGAAADGSRVFFAARGAMAGAPVGPGYSLYEWSADGLSLVSVLPDGTPAPPTIASEAPGNGTGFGAVGGNCTTDQAVIRNAISEDGSIAFWTYAGKYKNSEKPLFARVDGTETIQLDAKVAGEKSGGGGKFWAASADGSKVFFTAPGKLTSDAKAAGGLYRYDTGSRTALSLTPGTTAPEVEGVIGASEDSTYAYFVAKGALTGAQESAGEKAAQGAHNLYVWHEGEGLRFIAALSELDQNSWESAPALLSARLTPDGRHLAFLTVEAKALAGYDPRISSGGGCQVKIENALEGDSRCGEAFIYDAEAKALTCASCNPSGSRPTGPAELPFWTNPYAGPRYLSDDGSRLFFESRDVLSAADQNTTRDVYEFERASSGTCDAKVPDFDPVSGGCIALISGGTSSDHSYLIDASSDGRDVFFSTRSPLVGWDINESYDVYDARIGGGFPEPGEGAPPCLGEACKAPPGAPAGAPAPGTPSFQGPGNAAQKPKPRKHKHKKKSKHKSKKRHARADHKRGVRR